MYISTLFKAVSYLYPISIWKGSSKLNPLLELSISKGQWQLTTNDAIYSDGTRYTPLVTSFRYIRSLLPNLKEVLSLGSGLGSAVFILNKAGHFPNFTLVDNDSMILKLAGLVQNRPNRQDLKLVCQDGFQYISETDQMFDLIIIDMFRGRKAPAFVTDIEFISHCIHKLEKNGALIMNYILNDSGDSERFQEAVKAFPIPLKIISSGLNRLVIAQP